MAIWEFRVALVDWCSDLDRKPSDNSGRGFQGQNMIWWFQTKMSLAQSLIYFVRSGSNWKTWKFGRRTKSFFALVGMASLGYCERIQLSSSWALVCWERPNFKALFEFSNLDLSTNLMCEILSCWLDDCFLRACTSRPFWGQASVVAWRQSSWTRKYRDNIMICLLGTLYISLLSHLLGLIWWSLVL